MKPASAFAIAMRPSFLNHIARRECHALTSSQSGIGVFDDLAGLPVCGFERPSFLTDWFCGTRPAATSSRARRIASASKSGPLFRVFFSTFGLPLGIAAAGYCRLALRA